MTKTIGIGELRQNPARMLREVRSGATFTITDRGKPVAYVVAEREPHWVPGDEVENLLQQLGPDDAWAREIAADRAAEDATDPWDGVG